MTRCVTCACDWHRVTRHFRDGHTEPWWAAELEFMGYGLFYAERAVCVTSDRRARPALSTWYPTTNLPDHVTSLAEVVRLYGLRHWIEQSYRQMKNELCWADFMVRSDRAIRRHWALVCCAFAFYWCHETREVHLHYAVQSTRQGKRNPTIRRANAMSLATPAARGESVAGTGAMAGALVAGLLRQAPASRARRSARIHAGRMRH
jgi:hypothetical protein